jgi:streptogramin lyase
VQAGSPPIIRRSLSDQDESEHNRPTNVKFGPDGCAWVVDYGAVRDNGQAGTDSKFIVPADAPLVQIPHTGAIWRICPQ